MLYSQLGSVLPGEKAREQGRQFSTGISNFYLAAVFTVDYDGDALCMSGFWEFPGFVYCFIQCDSSYRVFRVLPGRREQKNDAA